MKEVERNGAASFYFSEKLGQSGELGRENEQKLLSVNKQNL